ncbi:hypothetical protein [Variovorax paradoxus]|uniref:Uncharacterized protein n=1 Tax=Variovorax paradoxus TaxID=34073 RepID=A0A6I6HNX9_VARPD|nr:hypothetical protein [Variovorax paradoxus]QGW84402.1 hypothetical protein GOQ09_23765 [Variovorax paradoxus]
MKRPEGWLKRLPCFSPDAPFDRAYVECETLAKLADWYDRCMASGRRVSGDELAALVEHVSGLRAREKMARSKRAVEKKADEFAEFFYGRDHYDFGAIRARQIAIEEARREEVPRHTVWTLGSRLWCLRLPKESTATASTHTLKLMELGGQLIRGSLRGTEHAEPLILAFAQGVVLGFSLLAKIDITNALEGLDFWRPCELASIYHVGIDRGQRLRAQGDRNPRR